MSIQSLERGLQILKLLSIAGRNGMRLVDLHQKLDVSKSTAHRLLETLRNDRFVEQVSETRRYRLGHEIAVLGWSVAQNLSDLKSLCEPSVTLLAEETGDTAFMFVQSGLESICLDRRSGTYPVKAFTVDVGVRRPLCIGASGIAFMALMSPSEVDATLEQLREHIKPWPTRRDALLQAIERARIDGYAFSDGFTVPDVRGIANVVRNHHGDPVATLGIAAIASRIGRDRLPRLVEKLSEIVELTEERLSAGPARTPRQSKK